MLQDLQDSAGARQAFEKSLALAPTYAAYSNLGGAYFDDGNYTKAAEHFEKAVEINDRDYRPWAGLGESYRAAGLDAKARPAFERAITLAEKELVNKPNDSVLLGYLALYYAKLGVRDKALTRLETALALAPADPLTLNLAARTSEALGDRAAALQNLTAALAHGYSKDDVLHEPDFKKLRQDVAFRSLIK
jgi:serine/threonine-protein kinase